MLIQGWPRAFTKPRSGHVTWAQGWNPPTSPCPTLSAGAEPKSQGHCQKWHHKLKFVWRQYTSIANNQLLIKRCTVCNRGIGIQTCLWCTLCTCRSSSPIVWWCTAFSDVVMLSIKYILNDWNRKVYDASTCCSKTSDLLCVTVYISKGSNLSRHKVASSLILW